MKASYMNLQACSGFVIAYAKDSNINYYNLFSIIYQQDRDKISKIDIEYSQNKTLNSFDDGMKYLLSQVNKMVTGKYEEFNEQYLLCVDVFGDIIDGK
jgi:hypothetical protein